MCPWSNKEIYVLVEKWTRDPLFFWLLQELLLGCLNILEWTTLHCTHREVFWGFLWVCSMLLQLITTLCTMQYLISVGFPKDLGKRADRLHCSKVALWKQVTLSTQTCVKGAINHFYFALYFVVINPIRTWRPQKKKKTLTNPCKLFPIGTKGSANDLIWLSWV